MSDKLMYTKNELVSLLQKNVATVTFTKLDGSTRVMKCTLMPRYLPQSAGTEVKKEQPGKALNENIIATWDLDKKDWRAFRVNSVVDQVVLVNE